MSTRLTKQEFEEMRTLGALNPVGHALIAVENDDAAKALAKELQAAGFGNDDILVYTSGELFPDLNAMMRNASGAAGFGYEIQLMRRYMTLAGEGVGWVVVYAPEEEQIKLVQDLAKKANARSAVHYGRLLHEDLI
jgi:hypothetical protein